MQVRMARVEDVPAVVIVEREISEAPHWTEEEYVAIALENPEGFLRRCFFVAEGAAGVVGFAVGKVVGAGLEAALESVAVATEARRSGVGRALCEAVIGWCGVEGATAVELEVRSANVVAIRLYRGMGFVEEGVRRRYYSAPVDDAISMRRVIGGTK